MLLPLRRTRWRPLSSDYSYRYALFLETKAISFGRTPNPCLFLQLCEFFQYFSLKLGSQVVCFFEVDLPLFAAKSIVFEARGLLVLLLAAGLTEVFLDLFLDSIAKREVFD